MKQRIALDGWYISVDWDVLYYGQTFFVPSVNVRFDRKAIKKSALEAGCGIEINVVTENEVRGLRVWVMRATL